MNTLQVQKRNMETKAKRLRRHEMGQQEIRLLESMPLPLDKMEIASLLPQLKSIQYQLQPYVKASFLCSPNNERPSL